EAFTQMKWVYSFHMPMFFVLVGLVYKDREMSLESFIKRQFLTRLVPVWLFNLVGMVIEITRDALVANPGWIGEQGWLVLGKHYAIEVGRMVLCGLPTWNVLTWFVICLFMVELGQFLLRKPLGNTRNLVISVVCFAVLLVLTQYLRPALVDIYGERIHCGVLQRR
ncbi:MAG: acyltransferase family protein, partial [Planctomycetota bacterium]